jgi:hypothetical protein
LAFHDGSVVGLGPAETEGTFTIVGASGTYAGAAGTYTVTSVDGDALEFRFTEHTES